MLKGKLFLYAEFARETKSFQKLATHMHSELTSDEVHDFRVLTRKLRAPLWLMRHCAESGKANRAEKELRKLGSKLGEMRKLDVAIEDGKSYKSDTERAIEAGGWAGTDDVTSTAPSDEMGNPSLSEEEKPFHTIMRDLDESVQLDEERQESDAEDADEATEKSDRP